MANSATIDQAYHGIDQHGTTHFFSTTPGEFLLGSMNEILVWSVTIWL